MGAGYSGHRSRDGWVDDHSSFRTYTLPRSNRSVSLLGSSVHAAHPDDRDDSCRLLSVKHNRFSRSHSLDEGTGGLAAWALQQLQLIDQANDVELPIDEPKQPKTRKTGITEQENEAWKYIITENLKHPSPDEDLLLSSTGRSSQTCLSDTPDTWRKGSLDTRSPSVTSGGSALTAEVLGEHDGDRWDWVDQDGVCPLTERSFDELDPIKSNPKIVLTLTEECTDLQIDTTTELEDNIVLPVRQGRKSEPTISVVPHPFPLLTVPGLELRRHTLPNTSSSDFELPSKLIFNTTSWETLPPAEEMEVMENKPIQLDNDVEYESLCEKHRTLSRSLNSSLSSMSELSVQDDFSESELPEDHAVIETNLDTFFTQEDICPEVFLDPIKVYNNKNTIQFKNIPNTVRQALYRNSDNNTPKSLCTEYKEHPVPEVLDERSVSPEPITGVLQLCPMRSDDIPGEIILSVSIPEPKKCKVQKSTEDCEVAGTKEVPSEVVEQMKTRREVFGDITLGIGSQVNASVNSILSELGNTSSSEMITDQLHDDQSSPIVKKEEKENKSKSIRKKKSFRGKTLQKPETFSDLQQFLKEVETRIPKTSSYNSSSEYLESQCSTVERVCHPSATPTVVLDAFTQTSPARTPACSSPTHSFTWINDCSCDAFSLEPCASSVALSSTEDDFDEDCAQEWSEDEPLFSSRSPSPTSPMVDDSSFSLSESLDNLDNIESGIGTVSTRPSTSPPTNLGSLEFSGSNLSSEDTGIENSFDKRVRRYLPNAKGRLSNHSLQYRRRKQRSKQTDHWIKQEHQTTQTDPQRTTRASSEEARTVSPDPVRHTISEPRLADKSCQFSLRVVSSEAALPPLPHSRAHNLPTLSEDRKGARTGAQQGHGTTDASATKAVSAPVLQVQFRRRNWRSSSTSTPLCGSFSNINVKPHRTQSAKELSEIEAVEACKWLRAAGFPQYAQMYEDFHFPLDLVSVERDHSFLEADSLQALFRRLKILNRCARIRLDTSKKSKVDDSEEEDQECALSGNWQFQRHSRRWSRIDPTQLTIPDKDDGQDIVRATSECSDELHMGQFKRSGSDRLKDGAKALLRRMESLKSKKKRLNRDGIVIGSPKVQDESHMQARMVELGCVDITPDPSPPVAQKHMGSLKERKLSKECKQSMQAEDSSSQASDQSQSSTPMLRSRRRRKLWNGRKNLESTGAVSDSECQTNVNLEPRPRPTLLNDNHAKNRDKPRTALRHANSLTYGQESQKARETFLVGLRGRTKAHDNVSPLHSPDDPRHSIYDNVPLIICNKTFYDFNPPSTDVDMPVQEGSGSSECTMDSRESPQPSTQDDDEIEERSSRRGTIDRWHSFNKKSESSAFRQYGTHINGFSVGQMNHLRKRALLRLTALMERYCPANRNTWNWELPKFMRKMKTPDYKDRILFGVPLQVINQRLGQPLPPSILQALSYLRRNCLDQVGIFRKPGVKTRIQRLRELHEVQGGILPYSSYCPCDIADMVKTYFRELPEVLLTNKLSEIFITICQYLPESMRVEALQCAMLMMPDENREALMVLLTFLSDVAANSHLNQMTANNLAVCMAPSLFHLNIGNAGSSPLRRRPTGTPEQKDLHDNKASHHCLTLMIEQVSQLQCVPMEMLSNCRFSYLDNSQPVTLEDLGSSTSTLNMEGDWSSYMNACIKSLLKETREKNKGWIHVNNSDALLAVWYRKVGDGHPLRLWKVTTEVEAPPTELLTRILRERHLWDDNLIKWRVVSKLSKQSEVFQYMSNAMSPRPSVDFCVLRCWRTDIGRGVCVVVETSVEHSDAPALMGCLRGIVLASRYLIQPCGSGKSRLTHISRVDTRGRLPEWYNKTYPFLAASHVAKLRDSFQHSSAGPESNV